ncbi:MAG TPA: caspase family protein [Smithellaceae bacterium]|jgi:hypothetical protein|nr:caspase family protein [Smithellaceae bacterium]HQP25553.1 caspase family protein [Smithellaceae bacterium]
MMQFAKSCLVFILSIAIVFQGCSAVHNTAYEKGCFLNSESVGKVERKRKNVIELLSPTSIRVVERIEYADKKIDMYEKVEVTEVYKPNNVGGDVLASIVVPIITFGFGLLFVPFLLADECKKTNKDYAKNCDRFVEKQIISNAPILEETYSNITYQENPITTGQVQVLIKGIGSGTIYYGGSIQIDTSGNAIFDLAEIYDKLRKNEELTIFYRYSDAIAASIITANHIEKAFASRTPPHLTIGNKVTFTGALQGGVLEGEQAGEILLTIRNSGKGNAFGVKLVVTGTYPMVTIPSLIAVGDIPPGASRKVAVPVAARLNAQSGKMSLSFKAKEQFGKDSITLKLQPDITIRQIDKPQLEVISVTCNDTGSLATGNGNGILENGETIEVIAKVKNNGEGPSKGVVLRFGELPDGITPVVTSVQLGNISAGGIKEGALAFQIPKLYRAPKETLPFQVSVSDVRPIGKPSQKKVFLPYRFKEPIIRVANMEIFDGDPETSSVGNRNHLMNKGEQVEVRALVENVGTMTAENVAVTLKMGRPTSQVTVSPTSVYLGKIAPNEKGRAAIFSVDIPGSVALGAVKMDVTVTQKDFGTQYANFNRTIYDADMAVAQADFGRTNLGLQKAKTAVAREAVLNIDEVPYDANFRRPNAHALLIGIGKYKREKINSLKYAVADVRTLRDYLVNIGGVSPENVTILADEEATLSGIKEGFEKLTRKAKPDSDVFIYFSGHGVPDLEWKLPYLLPYDGNPNSIRSTGFAVSEMKQIVNSLPTKHVLIAMDACFTGQGRSVLAEGTRGVAWVDVEKTQTDAIVITASNEKQASWDWPDKAHGIFTYHFLNGLRGAGTAKSNDGYIYAEELFEYLAREVPATALEKHGVKQNPIMLGNGKGFRLTKRVH